MAAIPIVIAVVTRGAARATFLSIGVVLFLLTYFVSYFFFCVGCDSWPKRLQTASDRERSLLVFGQPCNV